MTHTREFKAYFPCIGIGVGAKGFQRARARVGNLFGSFRVIGGVDNDARAVANGERYLGTRLTIMDLFTREQYVAWHGKPPPDGWREATPADIRRSAGYEYPNVIFTSPPCKGYSGLTSESRSQSPKYQALNELALRTIFLTLEAFQDDPPEFFVMENVPRILSRGIHFLELITQLLLSYGYAVATPPNLVHDCGEIGHLAQSRKRFLLIARNIAKVPNFLYQPPRRPLRAVGEVLERLPMPDDPAGGPLHRLPSLSWKTWVRLAFVEAGKDWRSLNRLAVEDGVLRDYALVPAREYRNGVLGVTRWGEAAGTIAGENLPTNGKFSVADPTWQSAYDCNQYGVRKMEETSGAITGGTMPGQGAWSIADLRLDWNPAAHQNKFRVVRYDSPTGPVIGSNRGPGSGAGAVQDVRYSGSPHFNNIDRVTEWTAPSPAVSGGAGPARGGLAVQDVRPNWCRHQNALQVNDWERPGGTVIGGGKGVQGGWQSVADVRPEALRRGRSVYVTAGHYGMVPWTSHAYAITGSLQHDSGYGSVADIRLPEPNDRLRCLIIAEDGTWHRPFTTAENAALQSIFDPEEIADFELRGASDQVYREWIGNAAPRDSMEAVGSVLLDALLLASSGQTRIVSDTPVWVQPIIAAVQCGEAV